MPEGGDGTTRRADRPRTSNGSAYMLGIPHLKTELISHTAWRFMKIKQIRN